MAASTPHVFSNNPVIASKLALEAFLEQLTPFMQQVKERLLAVNPPETRPFAESLAYSLEVSGKLIRPALSMLSYKALLPSATDKEIPDALLEVATVSELIHVATLLHDDVLDESDLRRGRPTTKQRFGNTLAILGGDWLLAQASLKLARLGSVELVALYAQVLADLCDGEVEQFRSSYALEAASWDLYFKKSMGKTASLFAASCQAAAILTNSAEEQQKALHYFGERFGLAFQLVDDGLDYQQDASTLGKPALADLKQGLINAPILLALESDMVSNSAKEELKQAIASLFEWQAAQQRSVMECETLSSEELALTARILELLQAAKALQRTRQLALHTMEDGLSQLSCLPQSEHVKQLEQFARLLIERQQ